LLEKSGSGHVKVVIHPEFTISINDIKEPSAEATALGGRFYTEILVNGGRNIADEAIKRSEEETHRASEEEKRAAERERRIGICFC
jgi:hypothetical protein